MIIYQVWIEKDIPEGTLNRVQWIEEGTESKLPNGWRIREAYTNTKFRRVLKEDNTYKLEPVI